MIPRPPAVVNDPMNARPVPELPTVLPLSADDHDVRPTVAGGLDQPLAPGA
ncbi:hypothetical protein GCM10009612_74560 [Streptomyces beijiangensis]